MRRIYTYLRHYSSEIEEINQLLVSAFIDVNGLKATNNKYIKSLGVLVQGSDLLTSFTKLVKEVRGGFSIELLLELFEFVVSPIDKSVNGAVYTPEYIRAYLVEATLSRYPVEEWPYLRYADISCGCGGFFISLANHIREHLCIPLQELYPLFHGIDIEGYSIERTKILLNLYALLHNEDVSEVNFNLWQGNTLSFSWENLECFQGRDKGFDIVLGNPPYVTSSRMSEETKNLMSRWEVSSSGKADLYIPFTQIGIEVLRPNGVLGCITVNSFYRSLNGRALRQYLSKTGCSLSIIDFLGERVFRGRSTYTCLMILQKSRGNLLYARSSSKRLKELAVNDYSIFAYEELDDYQGWQLYPYKVVSIVKRIQSTGIPLGRYCCIRNGFATLKNDIYILNCVNEDALFYYTQALDQSIFKIEKTICRDVIKPNTLHREADISAQIEKLIFPYYKKDGKIVVMSEEYLSVNYPYAYEYLSYHRLILAQRDRGTKEYEEWFAFGRSQALDISGNKLFFPYLADKPRFVLSENFELLFYNGYAIVSRDLRKLRILQKILSSSIFWFYITHTSKPYGNNYFALAKNYIKSFGIPLLSRQEEEFLLQETCSNKIDLFLEAIYQLKLKH